MSQVMALSSIKEHLAMIEQALPLTMFYKGWDVFQQNLIKVISPLSPEQLAAPAASHHWSVGRVAQHIVGNRVWWFQGWMGEGSRDLASIAHWDEDAQPARSAAELVAGLEATWRMVEDALAHWTPADLEHVFPLPPFLSEEERRTFRPYTRQWIIWHVHEHEILHSGELSLALGSAGLTTIYD
jgi:uncharacterized damage-inducible protein DinB